ncbi:unnamed protein product [Adineta ricciae]|uniref:G-protein coupled receptors family 1 profile domain-containing protein n=1 Tax=Adineta ricciae TaxID=249248 RepID=A0A815Z0F2_ADIRI|nr:unnamed protein product [Adineta ricciae]
MDAKNEAIATLRHVAMYLNRSIPIPLLIFGTIGNILNVFILTRQSLRTNSCAFYFLSSTLANILCLWTGLLTRLLSGYNLDPTAWSTVVCQIRFYITYMSLSLSACFLVYASVDRWASSSTNPNVRSFSRIHNARYMVIYTTLFACVFYGQTFYCYVAVPNQFPVNCYCPNQVCRTYNDVLFLILFSMIPPMFMLSFGYMTIKNVQKIRQQVRPLSASLQASRQRHRLLKKKDHQMIMMLLVQVFFFVILVTPSGISKAYSTLTFNQLKDSLELTKENFFFQISVLILYINCCSAFYLYTLTGKIFRQEVKRLLVNVQRSNLATTSEVRIIPPDRISAAYHSQTNRITMKYNRKT